MRVFSFFGSLLSLCLANKEKEVNINGTFVYQKGTDNMGYVTNYFLVYLNNNQKYRKIIIYKINFKGGIMKNPIIAAFQRGGGATVAE